jgi:glycerophosphodiester phosphodiesterase
LEAVIYHDFSLSESGTDIPIHDLTLAQYKHASDIHEPRNRASCNLDYSIEPYSLQKPRAWSSGEESASQATQLRQRLQYTVDFQTKGFKPNSRGDVIQDSLTTLEELLVKLPLEIGFNIEISTCKTLISDHSTSS